MQLITLQLSDLVFAKVGQLKVNNNQVMCHLSMKLSDTFDQNPPCTLDTREGFLRKNIVAVSFFQNCAIHQYS